MTFKCANSPHEIRTNFPLLQNLSYQKLQEIFFASQSPAVKRSIEAIVRFIEGESSSGRLPSFKDAIQECLKHERGELLLFNAMVTGQLSEKQVIVASLFYDCVLSKPVVNKDKRVSLKVDRDVEDIFFTYQIQETPVRQTDVLQNQLLYDPTTFKHALPLESAIDMTCFNIRSHTTGNRSLNPKIVMGLSTRKEIKHSIDERQPIINVPYPGESLLIHGRRLGINGSMLTALSQERDRANLIRVLGDDKFNCLMNHVTLFEDTLERISSYSTELSATTPIPLPLAQATDRDLSRYLIDLAVMMILNADQVLKSFDFVKLNEDSARFLLTKAYEALANVSINKFPHEISEQTAKEDLQKEVIRQRKLTRPHYEFYELSKVPASKIDDIINLIKEICAAKEVA